MKTLISIATIVSALGMAAPASAQAIVNDARCFVLSNAFAKAAKDENGRKVAAASMTFYLGRLDGKATPAVIADTITKQAAGVDPKMAATQMSICAAKLVRTEQGIQAMMKPPVPKK